MAGGKKGPSDLALFVAAVAIVVVLIILLVL